MKGEHDLIGQAADYCRINNLLDGGIEELIESRKLSTCTSVRNYIILLFSGYASLSFVVSEVQLSAIFRLPYQLYLGKAEGIQTFQVSCQSEQLALCFYSTV